MSHSVVAQLSILQIYNYSKLLTSFYHTSGYADKGPQVDMFVTGTGWNKKAVAQPPKCKFIQCVEPNFDLDQTWVDQINAKCLFVIQRLWSQVRQICGIVQISISSGLLAWTVGRFGISRTDLNGNI